MLRCHFLIAERTVVKNRSSEDSEDFFPLKKGGGDWPWMTLCTLKDFQVNIHGTEITETNELGEKILSKMCIAAAALIQLYTVGSMDFLMKKHHELQN